MQQKLKQIFCWLDLIYNLFGSYLWFIFIIEQIKYQKFKIIISLYFFIVIYELYFLFSLKYNII